MLPDFVGCTFNFILASEYHFTNTSGVPSPYFVRTYTATATVHRTRGYLVARTQAPASFVRVAATQNRRVLTYRPLLAVLWVGQVARVAEQSAEAFVTAMRGGRPAGPEPKALR